MSIYDSAAFEAIAGPVRITSFNMRPEVGLSIGSKFGFDNLELVFSVTSDKPNRLQSTFDRNYANASDSVTVFDAAWSVEVVNGRPSRDETRPFDFKVPLSTPFEFDPADGNLLVDWIFGSPIPGQTAFDRDTRVFDDHQTQWGQGSSASGVFTVPIEFEFEPVPEPNFGKFFVLLPAALLAYRRKRS